MNFPVDAPILPQRFPPYFYQLRTYPLENPILIAVDKLSLRKIHAHWGVCLYCPDSPETYQLGFCYQRELWILYFGKFYFHRAIRLAQAVQAQGAMKILALRV